MGNQLVGVAPSQIYPVEHYLSDHVDLTFDQSLGSTRFLKVARARSREGLVVVKVFAIHDPSLPLAEHKERILKVKEQLASAFNCLPFQRVILTDKAGLIMRAYCKFSVYDRMSTRPFLTVLEKKWITFQVLYALHRMHKLGICHGDIKLENIMVTSWLWVLLTDIASFKPTFLPDDNPADFSYFFDTSRRRLCYVAPERFISAPDPHRLPGDDKPGSLLLSESQCKGGDLLPSMDIFSAGCALLELWNEGTPALDLPGLLAFRNSGERPPSMTVTSAEPQLTNLLHSMTAREPRARHSAEIYLDEARGTLFPEYFYSFLQSYMLIFSAQPILPPDEKILRIYQDIRNIIKIFTQPTENKNYQDLVEETMEKEKPSVDNIDKLMKDGFKLLNLKIELTKEDEDKTVECRELSPDSEGLILITALVTSCIRGLHHCTSKLYALEILQLLCENSSSETILDRILPYIIHLTQDPISRVRALALNVLSACVKLVSKLPATDTNVFPEYILPEIAARATDTATTVRIAYANNIASLAETAVRFLDQTQSDLGKDAHNINYEAELSTLHEMVRSTVSSLLTDSQASVKRALVENGITKLCVFFGKQKANDVILSHMVTFLNDKESASLRGCFFDYVVGVAAFVGHQAAPILTPLLQQGLTDQSEWIIARAIRATSSLAELGLLPKSTLCSLLNETVPYLAHPNLAIRHEVCGLVSCVASLLNPIDVNCKVLPLVWPHLKHKLIQVEYPALVAESLRPCVPRCVLDAALRHRDVDRLLATLRERHHARLKVNEGTMPQYSEMEPQLKNLFRRLASDGMTEHVENQLLAMSAHLIKIQTSSTQHITDTPGRLSLKNINNISKSVPLDATGVDTNSGHGDKQYAGQQNRRTRTVSHESQMNTEWQHMFGHSQDAQSMRGQQSSQSAAGWVSEGPSPSASHPNNPLQATPLSNNNYVHNSMAPCRDELKNLTNRMQQKYLNSIRSQETTVAYKGNPLPPPSWRPGNQLLAYLHEHKSRVNRLVTLPSNLNLFASCSDDGTVRLWDANKMDGHAYINRAKCSYNRGGSPVIALSACEGGGSLVGATQEGSIFVLRPDASGSRMTLSQCRQTGGGDGGGVVDLCWTPASPSLVTYITTHNDLIGWDLRQTGNAFKLTGSVRGGVYTCVWSHSRGGVVAGSGGGALALWDLRFHLPVATAQHPAGERIRRVVVPSWDGAVVWSAASRDVTNTSLESTQRTLSLLHHAHTPSSQFISSIYVGSNEGGNFVLTGGSDCRVRFWRPQYPEHSYVLIHAYQDSMQNQNVQYRSRIIDGTTVIQEVVKQSPVSHSLIEESIYQSVESRSAYHTAAITDITMAQGNKCYLVTSSADGVINVWK